jgi:hypothetical protein
VARMWGQRNACRVLVGNSEGKRALGRPGRRWLDIFKMNVIEIGCDGVDLIQLVRDRDQWRALPNVAMKLWTT